MIRVSADSYREQNIGGFARLAVEGWTGEANQVRFAIRDPRNDRFLDAEGWTTQPTWLEPYRRGPDQAGSFEFFIDPRVVQHIPDTGNYLIMLSNQDGSQEAQTVVSWLVDPPLPQDVKKFLGIDTGEDELQKRARQEQEQRAEQERIEREQREEAQRRAQEEEQQRRAREEEQQRRAREEEQRKRQDQRRVQNDPRNTETVVDPGQKESSKKAFGLMIGGAVAVLAVIAVALYFFLLPQQQTTLADKDTKQSEEQETEQTPPVKVDCPQADWSTWLNSAISQEKALKCFHGFSAEGQCEAALFAANYYATAAKSDKDATYACEVAELLDPRKKQGKCQGRVGDAKRWAERCLNRAQKQGDTDTQARAEKLRKAFMDLL